MASKQTSTPVASEFMDWREDRIGSAARGENPTVLAELRSGYAVIGDVQFLPGYSLLLGKDPNAKALADMPRAQRVRFLADVDLLADAVERACKVADPAFRRVNIDILGNADAFVHAHIWPRYEWEPPELIWRPVWLYSLDKLERPHHTTRRAARRSPSRDRRRAALTPRSRPSQDQRLLTTQTLPRFDRSPRDPKARNRRSAPALSAEGPASGPRGFRRCASRA